VSRVLALCADDFGASAAVNRGIVRLVAAGRLSEVSCMVNGPAWPGAVQELLALPAVRQGRVRLGLHFNLTEGRPVSRTLAAHWPTLPTLPALIANAHLGRLPQAAIADEWQAQLDAFVHAAGQAPAHLDGHQHVHHLPGVRVPLLRLLPGLAAATRVRDTGRIGGRGWGVKRALIAHTGGRTLSPELQRQGRAANSLLLGVYDFVQTDYRRLLRGWLDALPARGGMVFCHPADAQPGDPALPDAIAAARRREFDHLASDAFADDLAEADVQLACKPFSETAQTTSGG
jgi:chitin disaccharide deacetylase